MHSSSTSSRPVALVTGASRGIGIELARVFAERGHDLVVVARNQADLDRLAGELRAKHGINVTVLVFDLTDRSAPGRIFAELNELGLQVDVLVNNAGFGTWGPFAETDLQAELELIQVNIEALTHLTKLFLRPMLVRKRGRILNVASTASFQPGPIMAVYCASKAYVLSFTEAVAMEVEGSGVTITALCPGITATEMLSGAADANPVLSKLPRAVVGDAADVADLGVRGCLRGDVIVVPGAVNLAATLAARATPKWLLRKVSGAIVRRSRS